jgi:hypothetical protein
MARWGGPGRAHARPMYIDEVATIFRTNMTRLVAEAATRNQRRQTAKKALPSVTTGGRRAGRTVRVDFAA